VQPKIQAYSPLNGTRDNPTTVHKYNASNDLIETDLPEGGRELFGYDTHHGVITTTQTTANATSWRGTVNQLDAYGELMEAMAAVSEAVIQGPALMAVQLSDGSAITVTVHHPFWVDRGLAMHGPRWLQAGQLRRGDHLSTASGTDVRVTGLRYNGGHVVMYTLTVAYDHTFFVGSARVLVHNASGCYGMASQIEDLSGKPRAEVDTLLQARGATKKVTASGYTHYRLPDSSEIVIRPDGRVVRTPAPEYGPTGARTNKGAWLDQHGRLTTSHDTGEKLSD
jgi:Pretoxin HINT domain